MCQKRTQCFISAPFSLSRPPLCRFCVTLRCHLLHDCPEAHFLLSGDRCKHPFWDGRLIPPRTFCQLCTGLNCRATSTSRGLFSQLQLRSEADDLLRWGWSVCVWSWSWLFTKGIESLAKVQWKFVWCSQKYLHNSCFLWLLMHSLMFGFRYEHFFKASCA